MSHGPNRYRAERLRAEAATEHSGPATQSTARARRIIAVWNARARRGKPAEFFPTFETALVAGCWRLTYCCPACRQVESVDIRDFAEAHHPRAPISMLIQKLSCDRCCPNPPLAVLIELEIPTAELPPANMTAAPTGMANQRALADRAEFKPATIGDLARNEPRWVWLHCENLACRHVRAAALIPFVIRWGPNAPSDRLRASMRCTKCGHKGALTYSPSWIDMNVRWQPFPTEGDDQ